MSPSRTEAVNAVLKRKKTRQSAIRACDVFSALSSLYNALQRNSCVCSDTFSCTTCRKDEKWGSLSSVKPASVTVSSFEKRKPKPQEYVDEALPLSK
eukprot:1840024-Pleurochrysis_carterae.AAC.1